MKYLLMFLAGCGFAWAYDRHEARRIVAVLEREPSPYLADARWHDSGEAVETVPWVGTYPAPSRIRPT